MDPTRTITWRPWNFYNYKNLFKCSVPLIDFITNECTAAAAATSYVIKYLTTKIEQSIAADVAIIEKYIQIVEAAAAASAHDLVVNNSQELIDISEAVYTAPNELHIFNSIRNLSDLIASKNDKLLSCLADLELANLSMPAPLVYYRKSKYILLDGNCRFAFAKALNIPIKAQLITDSSTFGKQIYQQTNLNFPQMFLDVGIKLLKENA